VLAPWIGRAVAGFRPLIERLPSSGAAASTFDWRAKRFVRGARLAPLERHYEWKSVLSPEVRAALIRPERRGALDPLELLRLRHDESAGADDLARIMDLDLGIFLVEDMLVKTDRASMVHSLEARVPLLDTVVAELALSLPSNQKVRGFSKKRLLRRAAAPLLPRAILEGKKRGFTIPMAAWLRTDLERFAREVLSPTNVTKQGFFHHESVTRLLDDHAARREDNSRRLWALLVFSLWLDTYGTGAHA
jgi:asparagine synthase (glutamine-hydrolysing)